MSPFRELAAGLIACALLACSSSPDAPADAGPACTPTLPAACTTTPSYKTDIAPLVARTCVPCHSAGGQASDRNLTTYTGVTRYETTIINQVNGCLMPPAGAPASTDITPDERTLLLEWIVCGAPDN